MVEGEELGEDLLLIGQNGGGPAVGGTHGLVQQRVQVVERFDLGAGDGLAALFVEHGRTKRRTAMGAVVDEAVVEVGEGALGEHFFVALVYDACAGWGGIEPCFAPCVELLRGRGNGLHEWATRWFLPRRPRKGESLKGTSWGITGTVF